MKTIIKNYEIKQSATFFELVTVKQLNYTPQNITGWNIYGKIEHFYHSETGIYLTVNIENALNGQFSIGLSNTQTSLLIPGNYVYDISAIISNGIVQRLQSGIMNVTVGVTNTLDPLLPPMDNGLSSNFIDGGVVP